MQDRKIEEEPQAQAAMTKPPTKTVSKELRKKQEKQPTIPSQVAQFYLPRQGALSGTDSLIYRPALLGTGRLHFVNTRAGIDKWVSLDLLCSLAGVDKTVPWEEADIVSLDRNALDRVAPSEARFATLPASATKAASYGSWGKSLASFLYQGHTLRVWECPEYKQFSAVDEKEGDFRGRLAHLQHEKRDLAIEKLRKQYTPKLASLQERLRKARVRVDKEKSQYGQQKMQTAISVGATLLGALFGRKALSTGTVGRATTSMRGIGRAAREKEDIARALQEAQVLQQRLADLEQQFQTEAARIQGDFEPEDIVLREILIRPRKTDIMVGGLALVWTPWRLSQDNIAEPLFVL
jgi:hypothetical protein